MRGFFSALSFLTIVRINTAFDAKSAVRYFPLVGLLIGLGVYALSFIQGLFAYLAVVYCVFITRGLHLDGLADTSDAFFSLRDKVKMLEIMKDSRLGSFGVLAIVVVLLGRYTAFLHIKDYLMLIFIPSYSRFGCIYLMKKLPYGRKTGTAAPFFKQFNITDFLIGYTIILSSFFVIKGTLPFVVASVFFVYTFLLFEYFKSKIGVITGDMLGFAIETTQLLLLLVVAIYDLYV